LFLCVHFYREGTNTLWTEIKNDVLLYKIVDIVNWIRIHNDEFDVNEFCELARKFHLDEKCYFTFEILSQFYEFDKIIQVKEQIRPENTDFMDTIVVEGENRKIKRTRSFLDEAFDWRI